MRSVSDDDLDRMTAVSALKTKEKISGLVSKYGIGDPDGFTQDLMELVGYSIMDLLDEMERGGLYITERP